VIVAGVAALIVPAVTVKVAEVEPCGTITLDGTVAALVLELNSDTETPPLPAAAVRLIVPVPVALLAIVLGLIETPLSAPGNGLTVTPKVVLVPKEVAVKVTGVEAVTVPVVAVKPTEVDPCKTVTLEGTCKAAVLELDSETVTPLAPAAEVKLTVPLPVKPLIIVPGVTEILLSAGAGGLTVTPKVVLTPA
jgi:hypothetical protein